MYTIRCGFRHALRGGLPALLLCTVSSGLRAQELPPIQKVKTVETVEATPEPKSTPNELLGVVRDTAGVAIAGAEVIIPELKLRLSSNREGLARFAGVARGRYVVRARKIGYASQFDEFTVGDSGGIARFKLARAPSSIAPVVEPDEQPGISGTVGDVASRPIAGAVVRIIGARAETETDSSGRFHLVAKRGDYTLRVTRPGYDFKLVRLTVPADGGRRIAVWLNDATSFPTVHEARLLDSLRQKAAWAKSSDIVLFTHEQLARQEAEWLHDALVKASSRYRASAPYLEQCNAVVNGGPRLSTMAFLTSDEIESVEIYGLTAAPPVPEAPRAQRPTSIMNGGRTSSGMTTSRTSANRPVIDTQYSCPIIYTWLR
jgi:hypothetical protein